MKIAIFQNFFKPYNKGGAENVVENMIDKLKNQGHEVFLITTKPKKQGEIKEYNHSIKTYQISSSCHRLEEKNMAWKLIWHFSNICNPKRRIKLRKILKDEKPGVCISHNLIGLGLFLPRISNKLNIKHIHFLHDIQLLHPSGLMMWGQEHIINSYLAKIYQAINRHFFKDIYKAISPSSWLMKEHLNKGFFKQAIAEIKPLNKLNKEIVKTKRNNSFLFVGQIENHKGIEFLIDTFKEIENKDIELKVVGKGKELDRLRQLNKNDKRINFLGRLNPNEVKQVMSESCALIVPSLCYENSPTVIYEANENNLPVIASAIGGISELIKDSKMLFIPNDKEDLKTKIKQFI
ncbi:MAG: glycosyltransferase [Patescibacteria group bacterium]|jgi:glycosyltransferase involved in cell wall biosynthesis|nr:glycosyltransferase [Patescibacteria group bacterium]